MNDIDQLSQQLSPITTNPSLSQEDAELLARAKVHQFCEQRNPTRKALLEEFTRVASTDEGAAELLRLVRSLRKSHT
jgi:hypothetical protein